jgi:hypothetical protein
VQQVCLTGDDEKKRVKDVKKDEIEEEEERKEDRKVILRQERQNINDGNTRYCFMLFCRYSLLLLRKLTRVRTKEQERKEE